MGTMCARSERVREDQHTKIKSLAYPVVPVSLFLWGTLLTALCKRRTMQTEPPQYGNGLRSQSCLPRKHLARIQFCIPPIEICGNQRRHDRDDRRADPSETRSAYLMFLSQDRAPRYITIITTVSFPSPPPPPSAQRGLDTSPLCQSTNVGTVSR